MSPDSRAGSPLPSREPAPARWLEWMILAVLGTALAFVGIARLPQQAKVPFVLTLGAAAGLGFGLGTLARLWNLRRPRLVGGVLAVLIAAGISAGAWDTHQRLARFAKQERVEEVPEVGGIDAELERMLKQGRIPDNVYTTIEPSDTEAAASEAGDRPPASRPRVDEAELRATLERNRQRREELRREHEMKKSFLGSLAYRIPREWGRWPVWGAVAFWLSELGLAAGLGGWLAAQHSFQPETPVTDQSTG